MNKNLLFIATLLITTLVAASSGGEHGLDDHNAIPAKAIIVQAVNLGLLLLGLFFLLRKSIVMFFAKRQEDFKEQANKTAAALKQAEDSLKEIKNKMKTLENSEQESYANANTEAEKLRLKIISESSTQALKLKEDVKLIAAAELENAKNEIRKEMIETAIKTTQNNLQNQATSLTKKSEAGFVKDISKNAGQVTL